MKLIKFKLIPVILAGFALLALSGCNGTTGTSSDGSLAGTTVTTFENNTSYAVSPAEIVNSEINVTNGTNDIQKVTVTVDISGGYMGELSLSLMSPLGTTVTLVTGVANYYGSTDYNSTTFDDNATMPISSATDPFTGSYIPEGALADFIGEDANGTWTLIVEDVFINDGDQLNWWSMTIE